MAKRSRGQHTSSESTETKAVCFEEILLVFSVGLNWEKYGMCIPILPEVVDIIAEYALGTLKLVRERNRLLYYHDKEGLSAKWLSRFMDIARWPCDAPYGNFSTTSGLGEVNIVPIKERLHLKFIHDIVPHYPHGDTSWTANQWKWFLADRFETCIKRSSIINHITDIYKNSTRFYVSGYGHNYRYQFMLYEPCINTECEYNMVEAHLRKVLGKDNFDRFVRLRMFICKHKERSPSLGMQIFFFGPAVDINTVMQSPLFKQHSAFEELKDNGNTSLHLWKSWCNGGSLTSKPPPLYTEGCRRALSIKFTK